MSALFQPLTIGSLPVSHRVVLAPLTRFRADKNHIPLPIATEYYAQRASTPGTLLITEGTFISPAGGGMEYVPGIWNDAQIAAWRTITDAVHAKGCFIACQLWALGRAAKPEILRRTGHSVVGASAVPMSAEGTVPEALTEEGIRAFIDEYVQAAKNAMRAGFDAVEIHGANGYLPDQFLQDVSNTRTDSWGGSVENRARFGVAVASAVAEAIGANRVGYRMSPWSPFQGMKMRQPKPQFAYLARQLKMLGLAYIHIVAPRINGSTDVEATDATAAEMEEDIDFLLDIWRQDPALQTTAAIIAGGFDAETGKATAEKYKDVPVAIAFGRMYIANPDLPFRIREGLELTEYNRGTFYLPMETKGYVDYPFSGEYMRVVGKEQVVGA